MGSCCGKEDDRVREPLLDGPKNTLAKGETSQDFFKAMETNLKPKLIDPVRKS